jgi:hypothetical protein
VARHAQVHRCKRRLDIGRGGAVVVGVHDGSPSRGEQETETDRKFNRLNRSISP